MKKHVFFLCILAVIILTSCSRKLPQEFKDLNIRSVIYPDYTNITVPFNIAPLNFEIKEKADEFICEARSHKGEPLLCEGEKVQWNIEKWKKLLEENKGDTLYIDVYVNKQNCWYKYQTIKNFIAPEVIDSYISYRLIEPSYATYEYMTINQRNISNFDENVIFSNIPLSKNEDGQCINCHSVQNYNKTKRSQFHVRQYKGGTVFITPQGIKKVNLKTDYTISAGVYPAWHPTKNIIAYSVNNTHQSFYAKNRDKVEVFDTRSDLILYDVDKNEVRLIANDTTELETFPAWSPDGKYLYYSSAKYPDSLRSKDQIVLKTKDVHYNIYRKSFDQQTMQFGSAELVFDASAIKKSATFPRVSPDNRYLLFTLSDYGTFSIWHRSSDLQMIDLSTGLLLGMKEINSPNVESYHSWSSNGAWIVFSSRRDDGSYTRPYISYFKKGKAGKPFILPQKDPDLYKTLFKSYNIPEFMVEPVTATQHDLMNAVNKEALNAGFVQK